MTANTIALLPRIESHLAIALGSSSDMLVFDEQERGPADALRYQFETVSRMSAHEQEVVRELLEALESAAATRAKPETGG